MEHLCLLVYCHLDIWAISTSWLLWNASRNICLHVCVYIFSFLASIVKLLGCMPGFLQTIKQPIMLSCFCNLGTELGEWKIQSQHWLHLKPCLKQAKRKKKVPSFPYMDITLHKLPRTFLFVCLFVTGSLCVSLAVRRPQCCQPG